MGVLAAPVTAQDWAGGYFGLSVSGATGSVVADGIANVGGQFETSRSDIAPPIGTPVRFDEDLEGAGYGVRGGYMWQNGSIVFGGELSFSGSNIGYTGASPIPGQGLIGNIEYQFEIDNFAELRGILGTELAPGTLFFGSLGAVSAQTTTQFRFTDGSGGKVGVGNAGSDGNTRTGYSIGVGLSQSLTERTFLTVEYIYTDLGTARYEGDNGIGNTVVVDQNVDFSRLQVGVNFRF